MTGLPVAISIASSRLIPSSRDGCDLSSSPQHDRTFESRLNDVLAERRAIRRATCAGKALRPDEWEGLNATNCLRGCRSLCY